MGGVAGQDSGRRGGGDPLFPLQHALRQPDRPADAGVRSAGAEIVDGDINLFVGWVGIGFQQGCHRHDHTGCAKPALHHPFFGKGLLHGMAAIARQAFNRGDERSFARRQRHLARFDRTAIHIHRARPAIARATAIFGPGQIRRIAQRPKQGRLRVHPILHGLVIDGEFGHDGFRQSPSPKG